MTVRDHLVLVARADLDWLERRHRKWETECQVRHRAPWWLGYSQRDLASARFRLERLLEVDLRDPAPIPEGADA